MQRIILCIFSVEKSILNSPNKDEILCAANNEGVLFLNFLEISKMESKDIELLAPLQLAYIGDAVYELYIRTYILDRYKSKVKNLHIHSIGFVKAAAQAELTHVLEPLLTEEEDRVLKRGRNAKSVTIPKNAKVTDYKNATGFEALIGYLYLKKEYDRLEIILTKCIDYRIALEEMEGKTSDKTPILDGE